MAGSGGTTGLRGLALALLLVAAALAPAGAQDSGQVDGENSNTGVLVQLNDGVGEGEAAHVLKDCTHLFDDWYECPPARDLPSTNAVVAALSNVTVNDEEVPAAMAATAVDDSPRRAARRGKRAFKRVGRSRPMFAPKTKALSAQAAPSSGDSGSDYNPGNVTRTVVPTPPDAAAIPAECKQQTLEGGGMSRFQSGDEVGGGSPPDAPQTVIECKSLWNLARIKVPQVWSSMSASSMSLAAVPQRGLAKRGMVIDSGADVYHSNIGGQVDRSDSRTFQKTGYVTGNSTDGKAGRSWHGSHVFGTIAAAWDAAAVDPSAIAGIIGPAPTERKMVACNVFGEDVDMGCWDTDQMKCMQHALDTNSHWVLNLSLGGRWMKSWASVQVYRAMLNKICDAGGLVVVAAGNWGMQVNDPKLDWAFFPAAFAEDVRCVIAVGATDNYDRFAYFSNWGPNVKILAPGVKIDSALNSLMGQIPWNSAQSLGTSMSTPHVSGAALLLMNAFPEATNMQVKNCLTSTATELPKANFGYPETKVIGGGVLNVKAAYDCVQNLVPPDCSKLAAGLPPCVDRSSGTLGNGCAGDNTTFYCLTFDSGVCSYMLLGSSTVCDEATGATCNGTVPFCPPPPPPIPSPSPAPPPSPSPAPPPAGDDDTQGSEDDMQQPDGQQPSPAPAPPPAVTPGLSPSPAPSPAPTPAEQVPPTATAPSPSPSPSPARVAPTELRCERMRGAAQRCEVPGVCTEADGCRCGTAPPGHTGSACECPADKGLVTVLGLGGWTRCRFSISFNSSRTFELPSGSVVDLPFQLRALASAASPCPTARVFKSVELLDPTACSTRVVRRRRMKVKLSASPAEVAVAADGMPHESCNAAVGPVLRVDTRQLGEADVGRCYVMRLTTTAWRQVNLTVQVAWPNGTLPLYDNATEAPTP